MLRIINLTLSIVLLMANSQAIDAQQARAGSASLPYLDEELTKLSPSLYSKLAARSIELPANFTLALSDTGGFKAENAVGKGSVEVIDEFSPAGIWVVSIRQINQLDALIRSPFVKFIHLPVSTPKAESRVKNRNLTSNQINWVHSHFPAVNGENITVSVKEPRYDTTDLDIINRHVYSPLAASESTAHATDMATIIAGGGNTSVNGRGVANAALLTSSDFSTTLPDQLADYELLGVALQNHSYGTGIENFYGATAQAFDLSSWLKPELLHIFSAGNIGQATDSLGPFSMASGFANLTGNFKMAKNILTLASIDEVGNIDSLSSKGPAYDGRIKPELVAYSVSGSSNAAALTTGVCALLSQFYKESYVNEAPPAALLKAILINSAEDIAMPGPDFFSGFGNLNAFRAFEHLLNGQFIEGSIDDGGQLDFQIAVPADVAELKVSCVWSDPAAEPNAAFALINDLDLVLQQVATQTQWLPWVLNPFPHRDSLTLPAKRAVDRLNNVEQISIEEPEAGSYRIQIRAAEVAQGPQAFYIAYQWRLKDEFSWIAPLKGDNLPYNDESDSYFRWESTFDNALGKLELSTDLGASWELVEDSVDLSAGQLQWEAPRIWSPAIARMTIGGQVFETDTFSISHPIKPEIGFNCGDSILLSWPFIPTIESVSIHTIGNRYLRPVQSTTDTLIILAKSELAGAQYALIPKLLAGVEGIQSTTFSYENQSEACYIINFIANPFTAQSVELSLQLGTTYRVEEVIYEKENNGIFSTIATSTNLQKNNRYVDLQPQEGANVYRARVILDDQTELVSLPDTALFLDELALLLFPNPVTTGQSIQILVNNLLESPIVFHLFRANGQLVLREELDVFFNELTIPALVPGLYLYELEAGEKHQAGKLLVR